MAKKVLRVVDEREGNVSVYRGEVVPCFDLYRHIEWRLFQGYTPIPSEWTKECIGKTVAQCKEEGWLIDDDWISEHPVFDNLPYNTCSTASELAYELALHAFLGYEVVYDIEI